MATVLVTGSNRGIGLEFVRQYADAGWRVHHGREYSGSNAAGPMADQGNLP